MKSIFFCLIVSFLLVSCDKQVPKPVVLPKVIRHHQPKSITYSGLISRDLFRSFWILPARDRDRIHLGIIPSAPKVSFSSPSDFRIRVHQEHDHWDIFSPAGVSWEVQQSKQQRPQLVRYFCSIDYKITQPGQFLPHNAVLPWLQKGFTQAQWVGPPKMDAQGSKDQLTRYFLSLVDFHDVQKANQFCQTFNRRFDQTCSVIGRVELPLLGSGTIMAKHSNFAKRFTGIIELISKHNMPIHIHNVPTKLLSDERKTLPFYDQLFILPNPQDAFSVVESLPLGDYLEGVLPSEIYPSAPIEALKAQAVIARTYTLSQLWSQYALAPFYTCVTTQCQAYYGKKQRYQRVTQAISATTNQVLRSQSGDFAKTFYHASSGGVTDHAKVIFGHSAYVSLNKKGAGYNGFVSDFLLQRTFDLTQDKVVRNVITQHEKTHGNSTRYSKNHDTWQRHFSAKALAVIFGAPVLDISIKKRSVSGRAIAMTVTTTKKKTTLVNELKIRQILGGLPSSLMIFDIEKTDDGLIRQLHITGRGRGHGVGLSQLGAIGRAQKGQNHQQILHTYYPNTLLSTILPQ